MYTNLEKIRDFFIMLGRAVLKKGSFPDLSKTCFSIPGDPSTIIHFEFEWDRFAHNNELVVNRALLSRKMEDSLYVLDIACPKPG